MGQISLINGLQYAGYALELTLLALLLSRKRFRRFPALCAYVATLFGVDAVGRVWVLQHYGSQARRVYFYSYYLSDFVLALGVFLLVCTLFRRAFRDHQKVWEFIRPILTLDTAYGDCGLRGGSADQLSSALFPFERIHF